VDIRVLEKLVMLIRGSVKALKPAVCPGMLMRIPRTASGMSSQP
jgi:hypothetical protein